MNSLKSRPSRATTAAKNGDNDYDNNNWKKESRLAAGPRTTADFQAPNANGKA